MDPRKLCHCHEDVFESRVFDRADEWTDMQEPC